jgi:acetyl esterase/lipase
MLSALLLAIAQVPQTAPPTPRLERDVVYSRVNGRELQMDIYRPAAGTASAPASASTGVPAVVVVHGGAWVAGRRQDMARLCEAIADEGMLAATVSYRLAPGAKWPSMIDDVQTAVRFLRANHERLGIDRDRIGAAGASAGGHLAMLLGTRETRDPSPTEHAGHSSRVQAVFNIFGPSDPGRDFPPQTDMLFALVLGKQKSEAGDLLRDATPLAFVDARTAPTFILHGTADQVVPIVQSRRLEEKLREHRVPVRAVYVEGMGHDINPLNTSVADAVAQGIQWLKRHLAPPASRAVRKAA